MNETIRIEAEGAELFGTLFRPAGEPVAALALHPAVGVPQRFYRHFAEWAASQGRLVVTYDYRDMGASASGSARRSSVDLIDWGVKDQSAALRFLMAEAPGAPLHVVGHSLGGFMTPFQPEAAQIDAMITVASGPAYWRDHPGAMMPLALFFWWIAGPAAATVLGYVPGAIYGGMDLPTTAFRRWRSWCTHPEFYNPDVGGALPTPQRPGLSSSLKIIGFSDDRTIPPVSVARLAQRYPDASIEQMTINPAEYGLEKIDHLHAFARRNDAIWPVILPAIAAESQVHKT